ncbi:twin-arginine translocation signal domain-containing protein [Campylobacter geochelonis]|uniref:Formate dehydrogenase subunit or accessory protein n=1 Tax=Campylobacter geochelonis TaxID=1780362 RepID=A0A128E9W2_9BACT|nr:twin-arginine translocation signal domain-containing protein [Campylobacter geochelonis]QKF72026.1 putative formate dehydrogenase-associated protein [Campylobacter geochelonis]CZE45745.1 Formate dehydrogenase subunit or accessory protein [Campylobacter geochelonis]CZE46881.1 Formate dehydrogenase subunit or accessory protein [Campylobacter geochelonis]CZE49887.1 Formate dehydrogenase subunit or accessory protein [Campylobacter geochelonis]
MESKRRDFLKKAAVGAVGVAAVSVNASAAVPKDKIKKDSGKKAETLYQRTPQWELYYTNAK